MVHILFVDANIQLNNTNVSDTAAVPYMQLLNWVTRVQVKCKCDEKCYRTQSVNKQIVQNWNLKCWCLCLHLRRNPDKRTHSCVILFRNFN